MRQSRSAVRGPLAWAGALLVLGLVLGMSPPAAATPTFQIVLTNPSYETLAVAPSGVAYGRPVGSATDVWRATDEGRNWTKLFSFPSNYHVYYVTPLQSGALLAAVDTGSWKIFRSSDGGSTGAPGLTLPITPCFYTTLTPDSIAQGDGYVFLGTYNNCPDGQDTNYIYRSSDDGTT